MTALRAETRLAQGDWRGAAEDAEAILRNPQVAAVIRIPALIVLVRVRARRGDPGVQGPLDEAYALASSTGELQRIGPVVVLRAEVAWLSGDLEAETLAADEVERYYGLAQKQSDHWAVSELAFWLWRASRLTIVPALLAEPYALQVVGDWVGAARAWEVLGCPYERAMALGPSPRRKTLCGPPSSFSRRSERRRQRASCVGGCGRAGCVAFRVARRSAPGKIRMASPTGSYTCWRCWPRVCATRILPVGCF